MFKTAQRPIKGSGKLLTLDEIKQQFSSRLIAEEHLAVIKQRGEGDFIL